MNTSIVAGDVGMEYSEFAMEHPLVIYRVYDKSPAGRAGVPRYGNILTANGVDIAGNRARAIYDSVLAYSKDITDAITKKVSWLAPVKVYPGENELESLAENGYIILAGQTKIHTYNKDRIIED